MRPTFDKDKPLRVFEAFAGYGSQCLALERVAKHHPTFAYRLVGWSEIDKHAITAHNLLHPDAADLNFGDISKIDWDSVPDFDLLTYSSPCQDFSIAGLQKGGTEGSGTRSSLLWECRKAIRAKKPKYLLLENVKALVSKKFKPLFLQWLGELEGFGYANYWQVLNATDYGVPQNRERVFCLSIRKDAAEPFPYYRFPRPVPLTRCVQDLLQDEVHEKYYLSQKLIDYYMRTTADTRHNRKFEPTNGEGSAKCITTREGGRVENNYLIDDED